MCGFIGILNKNKQEVNSKLLRAMADTIHHRGPDEDGIFLDANIGLFHKRLSIIGTNTANKLSLEIFK